MSVLSSVNFIVSNYNISAEKKRVYTNINYPNQICLHGLKSLDFLAAAATLLAIASCTISRSYTITKSVARFPVARSTIGSSPAPFPVVTTSGPAISISAAETGLVPARLGFLPCEIGLVFTRRSERMRATSRENPGSLRGDEEKTEIELHV